MFLVRPSILLLCALIATWPAPGPASPPPRSALAPSSGAPAFLGPAEHVADGVDLFRVDGVLPPIAGGSPDTVPRSIRLLRLDPRRVRLVSALATGEIPGRATVLSIAQRAGAVAAVNAGFFSPTGDPNGLLKIDGRLLSDTGRARGAVALVDGPAGLDGLFDRVSARVAIRYRTGRRWRRAPVDGVDTARGPGRIVLYTPASGTTTDTVGGLEWTLRPGANGLRVASTPAGDAPRGNAAIPGDGYVVSFGGDTAPAALAGLSRAAVVQVRESLRVQSGQRVSDWSRAATLVGGAGLLVRGGKPLTDWAVERLSRGFETTMHPRTVIARDRAGSWWLITIDGRQPGRAIGMSFSLVQALLARLSVSDALNLDGGGSTTMVVGGRVVNHPSDLVGPRAVSDAIVVMPR